MNQSSILIVGIGNIFLGDDAFGIEVVKQLARRGLPAGVCVVDFGIRSYDWANALLNNYHAAILVDATARGKAPGTLYLSEPDLDALDQFAGARVDGKDTNPVTALQLAKIWGKRTKRLYLIGCEPDVLAWEEGLIGLSASLQQAVPRAIAMIETLLVNLMREQETPFPLPDPESSPSALVL